MTTQELLSKVKRIELKIRRKTNAHFLGEYHTSFKGIGMTFTESRVYQPGDDVRKMDWNKTARFNEPFVKIFEEERELTNMLVIDVSQSMNWGSAKSKREMQAEIAATLGLSSLKNNDKIGLILLGNSIIKFIPPKKGRTHLLRIIREIIEIEPQQTQINYTEFFSFYLKVMKKKTICFFITDAHELQENPLLGIFSKKHFFHIIRVFDDTEVKPSNLGLLYVSQPENSRKSIQFFGNINLSNQKFHKGLEQKLSELSKKYGFKQTSIATKEDYIPKLISLLQYKNR